MRCVKDIKPRLVYVIWYDSVGWRRGWSPLAEAKQLTPSRCETVGWLIDETKEYLIVSSTVSTADEVYSPLSIPKRTIADWGVWEAELKNIQARVRAKKAKRARRTQTNG